MNECRTIGTDAWRDFISTTVHDIRTPLSSMRVALEVLRVTGDDSEKRRKLIEILNGNVDELSKLLETFMNELPAYESPSTVNWNTDEVRNHKPLKGVPGGQK